MGEEREDPGSGPLESEVIEAEVERLALGWRRFWPAVDVDAIGADVVARARASVASWDLADVALLGGGEVALVCSARRGEEDVVLKLQPRGNGEEDLLAGEAAALSAWAGSGAVPTLRATADGDLTLLLERLRPGTPLDSTEVDWEERLAILGALAARLHFHGDPAAAQAVISLSDYAAEWRAPLRGEPDLLAELDSLLATTTDPDRRLLHADLHGGNALSSESTWKAIDPHAVRGDRHAEVWALIDPLAPPLPDDATAAAETAHRWTEVYAGAAGLDPERAGRWARVRAAAEAASIDSSPGAADDLERSWAVRLRRFARAVPSS